MSALRTVFSSAPLHPGEITLDEDEARHAATVLRMQADDALRVIDGAGAVGAAQVIEVSRRAVRVRVHAVEMQPDPRTAALTIATAPPKGDRLGDLVRAATELGVGAIWLLTCERSEREPAVDRVQRIAREAIKQCRRARLPQVRHAVALSELRGPGLWLADPQGGRCVAPPQPQPLTVVIGPEGGFTPSERDSLLAAQATPVRLAAPILRIETAAIAAAAVIAAAWDGSG